MTVRQIKNLLVKLCQQGDGDAEVVTLRDGREEPLDLLLLVTPNNPALGRLVLIMTPGDEVGVTSVTEEAPPG